jgi:hypothetical protein
MLSDEELGLKMDRHKLKSQYYHLLDEWSWTNYLTSLRLNSLYTQSTSPKTLAHSKHSISESYYYYSKYTLLQSQKLSLRWWNVLKKTKGKLNQNSMLSYWVTGGCRHPYQSGLWSRVYKKNLYKPDLIPESFSHYSGTLS